MRLSFERPEAASAPPASVHREPLSPCLRVHRARGVCSRLQRWAGEIETLAAKHQQKKIGMCPREGDIAAPDCFQPRRGPLANMCLHRGPKSREANRGEIAQ